jgi:hypothetical protein
LSSVEFVQSVTIFPIFPYDIVRVLDYFQAVKAPRDPRLAEAMDMVRNTRDDEGRWPLQYCYKGKTYFERERLSAPSCWNTCGHCGCGSGGTALGGATRVALGRGGDAQLQRLNHCHGRKSVSPTDA